MALTVRTMKPEEIHLAIDWAAAEGWNPGLHDAECFYAADRTGFLLAELNGTPIGCISAVRYDDSFGFLGLYIVLPEHRDKGYGLELWNAGMEYLKGRNIGLDGVLAQQENYRKSGFVLAHRNIRFELNHPLRGANMPAVQGATNLSVAPLSAVPIGQLLTCDHCFFQFSREKFLRVWISRPGTFGFAVLSGGNVSGYIVVRPCRSGHKIGPLFADSINAADLLFSLALAEMPSGPVYLDVPEVNPDALTLARRYSMNPIFETARMYTKGDPGLPLQHIYGITTFELG